MKVRYLCIVPYAPAFNTLFWIEPQNGTISLTISIFGHERKFVGKINERDLKPRK